MLSDLQIISQLLSISGSAPLLTDRQKCWHSYTNIAGEQGLPLKVFLFDWLKILVRRSFINSTNLGLNYESFNFDISWSLDSSSTGRIKVKQSLSLKNVVSSFLILFLRNAKSEPPFWGLSAFYKYYCWLIGCPF